jgi:hypothetical protein
MQKIRELRHSCPKRPRLRHEVGSGAGLMERAEETDDPALAAPPTVPSLDLPDGAATSTSSTNRQEPGVQRSRKSARNDRLSKAITSGRMELAEEAAQMRRDASLKVTQQGIESQERLAEQQTVA